MSISLDRPSPRPELSAIETYVPGASAVAGLSKVHKLSSNESPLGPSPLALEAFHGEVSKLALYPDGSARALRMAVAEKYNLDPARLICGNGSDQLLALLAHVYIRPGDEGIYSQFGFLAYPIAIRAAGGLPIVAKETALKADVDALLNTVTPRTRLIFLANPNNPTGSYLPVTEIRRLHANLRSDILLVLDAAYAEYVRQSDYDAGIDLVSANQNVVMTRTLSKIYGLASLRVGWAYGPPEVIDMLDRVRGPFNINAPAIAAGVAALSDSAHIEAAVSHNTKWLQWLTERLHGLGLDVAPSVGNFVLIQFPNTPRHSAAAADRYLNARGFVLRGMGAYGLGNTLRLTVGNEEANVGLIETLTYFMTESRTADTP